MQLGLRCGLEFLNPSVIRRVFSKIANTLSESQLWKNILKVKRIDSIGMLGFRSGRIAIYPSIDMFRLGITRWKFNSTNL